MPSWRAGYGHSGLVRQGSGDVHARTCAASAKPPLHKLSSQRTPRWREVDSNHRSRSAKGLSAVAEGRSRTDKLDRVIKHRSSRETTMVGRGASLHGRLFLGGTDGSNPPPSSAESANYQFRSRQAA